MSDATSVFVGIVLLLVMFCVGIATGSHGSERRQQNAVACCNQGGELIGDTCVKKGSRLP